MTEDKQMDCNPIKHRCPACQPVPVVEQERIKLTCPIEDDDQIKSAPCDTCCLEFLNNQANNQLEPILARELKKQAKEIRTKVALILCQRDMMNDNFRKVFESVFAEYLKDKE